MAATATARQVELTVDLKRLWNETLALYPQQIIEPATKNAMQKDWLKIHARVGAARFAAGVEEARMHTNWFPTSKEIQEYMPETVAQVERKRCDQCRDYEGWLRVMPDGREESRVWRCDHKPHFAGERITISIPAWGRPGNETIGAMIL